MNTVNRRDFLAQAAALTGGSLLSFSNAARAEPPPEVSRIRVAKIPAICLAPEYLAEEMFKLEGFTQVEYPELNRLDTQSLLLEDVADISVSTPPDLLPLWDTSKGKGVIALAPIHGGCYELFVLDPERAARYIVAKGYEPRYEVALEVVKSLSYGRWRTHNPDDSFRFHGLRLREAGLVNTPPNKLIAQGTDWRFLNELKKELKA